MSVVPEFDCQVARPARDLAVALLLVCLLIGSGLILLARRCAGALSEPLSPGVLLLVGGCVAATAIACRVFGRSVAEESRLPLVTMLLRWGPTAALAMFAGALAIDGVSPIVLLPYFAILVAAEFWSVRPCVRLSARKPGIRSTPDPPAPPVALAPNRSTVSSDSSSPHKTAVAAVGNYASLIEATPSLAETCEDLPEGLWQQTSRLRTNEGELVSGWEKVEFKPSERTAIVHVAFCPPLEETPELELEQMSGPPARIKAAQVLPHGARLEVRLNSPAVAEVALWIAFATIPLKSEAPFHGDAGWKDS